MKILIISSILSLAFGARIGTIPNVDWNTQAQNTLKERLGRPQNTNVAKNIIFFLGDGMGVSTVTGIRIYKGQKAGNPGEETILNMDKLPYTGLAKTYNTDRQVPDSAATATAFLSGVKANYGTVGVDQTLPRFQCEGLEQAKVPSIFKWSQDEGKNTGLVTSTRITHATPSVAYAHAGDRYWENDKAATGSCPDIARQLIENEVGKNLKVVLGGGRSYFTPKTLVDPEVNTTFGRRSDGRNLIEEWKQVQQNMSRRAEYVWNKQQFEAVNPQNVDYLLGMFAPVHLDFELDREETMSQPSLKDLTAKALDILKKDNKGYFLMVEGGRIDHAHHDGNAKRSLADGAIFDEAIGYAMDNTDQSDTLIIVTADHSHTFTIGGYPSRGNDLFALVDNYTSNKYPTDDMPYTSLAYANGPGYGLNHTTGMRQDLTNIDTTDKEFLQQSAVPTNSESHGGEDVAVMAHGPMSHLFTGVYEQNYIAHAMAYASCVGANKEHCNSVPTTEVPCKPTGAGHSIKPSLMTVLSCILSISLSQGTKFKGI